MDAVLLDEHRLAQMTACFPDARVTGHEPLTGSMANHPKGRHVLAPFGITVAGQDDFLEPRTAAALLAILAGPGHGCPRFARQCRALL